jgi:hypothetical protein
MDELLHAYGRQLTIIMCWRVVNQPLVQPGCRVLLACEDGDTGLPVEYLWEQGGAWKTRLELAPHACSRSVLRLAIRLPPRLPETLPRGLCRSHRLDKPLSELLCPALDLLPATLHTCQSQQWGKEPRQEEGFGKTKCRGVSYAGALTLTATDNRPQILYLC